MCHLLYYTVYKLCIVAVCLKPESWLIQICTTVCLCHGHPCFVYCILYTAACFMPCTLLFCVKGIAASYIVCYICTATYVYHGHYCFTFCMLCTATCVVPLLSCFVPRALLLDIFYATYILLRIYSTDTAVCAKGTAALYIVCCVLTHTLCHGHCYFEPKALLLHIIIICCVLPHVLCHGLLYIFYFMYYLPHIYVMATACTATCFVLWELLLHVLYPVY